MARSNADLLIAVRRNLARAENRGDTERVKQYQARIKELEPKAAKTQSAPSISYASPQAAERAEELGMGPDDFDFDPSGQTGYTVADVERAAGTDEEED